MATFLTAPVTTSYEQTGGLLYDVGMPAPRVLLTPMLTAPQFPASTIPAEPPRTPLVVFG